MEGCKGIFCRLCVNIVSNTNFTVIDESIKGILRTISQNLDFDNKYAGVICSTCSVKLYSAFGFKSTCLYVEDKIVSYVNPKISFVDLREVYLMEYDNKQLIKMENDQKICRLCLQLVNEGCYEVKLEMIHRYIPEVNFSITENPIVCRQCFDSLSTHVTFIKTCLDVGTRIDICDNKMPHFEHSNILLKSENEEMELGEEQKLEGLVKTKKELEPEEILINSKEKLEGVVKIKKELDPEETLINTDEVNVKSEGKCRESDSSSSDLLTIENEESHSSEDEGETKNEYMHKYETKDVSSDESEPALGLIHPKNSTYHQLISAHPYKARIYKCDTCTYKTKFKGHLKTHQIRHKGSSEIRKCNCDTCSRKAKCEADVKRCLLTHKLTSEIQIYKCDACPFKTEFKRSLKLHQSSHTSEIYMNRSDYEYLFQHSLTTNRPLPTEPREYKIYECDSYTYTRENESFQKARQFLNVNHSKIKMYKCDSCTYKVKRKSVLKAHKLLHEDNSGIQMYKCELCAYKTEYKNVLKAHQLFLHKVCSNITNVQV